MMTDKEYKLEVCQTSGFNSDASQNQVVQFGNHYHGKVYEKLVQLHNSPLTFDPAALHDIIICIDEGIDGIISTGNDFKNNIDIVEKNEINNHSKFYFEEFVELDFYPQFDKVESFLRLKVNQRTLQPKVDRVIKSLNRQIVAHQGKELFETVLLNITSKLIDTYYEKLKDKENEILLFLYFFYCNCCIGKKTHGEKNASPK